MKKYEIHVQLDEFTENFESVFGTDNEMQALNILRDLVLTYDPDKSNHTRIWLEFNKPKNKKEEI